MANNEKRNCRHCGEPMYFGGIVWWHTHSETQFCDVPSLPTMQQGEPENDAEDRVRCAAPELLAALKNMVAAAKSWHETHHSNIIQCDRFCELISPCEAAIAKAEGSDGE